MPYPGIKDPEMIKKMDDCVKKVMADGKDKSSAIAICHSSIVKGKELLQAIKEYDEVPDSFIVTKQKDGAYRWAIVSSSSFQDRDGEIVSQQALEDDTAHMNATGEYGTLDWWHTPLTLGRCDFSAMHGRLSVESGTFNDSFIATKLAEHSNELAASRSFRHSVTEPDANGVYSKIRTFARALLPRGKESNLLTQVSIASKENQEMIADKIKELKALLGGDKTAEAKVDEILASAEKSEQAAVAAGIAHKEEAPKTDPQPEPPVVAPPAPEPETAKEKEPGMFVADMTPDEFTAKVATGVAQALVPVLAQLKEIKDAQAAATEKAVKESGTATLAEIAKVAEAQAKLAERVGNLEGLTPRGYRATQDPATKTTKEAQPQDDPRASSFASFVDKMILGKTEPTAPKP